MKKKFLTLLPVFCLLLSFISCGRNQDSSNQTASIKTDDSLQSGETAEESAPDSSAVQLSSNDMVPFYLLAESFTYYGDTFSEHRIYERDRYGNITKISQCEENNDTELSVSFTAAVAEGEDYYHIDSPYKDVAYHFTFDSEGNLTSAGGSNWTLTYSDEEGSAFQVTEYEKKYSTDSGYSYTYVRKYDDNLRLVERTGYNYGSEEPKYTTSYTYDEKDRIIESHQIHYENNYDFDNVYTDFCEMDRTLIDYTTVKSKGTYYQSMSEYVCECTYDSAGNILTEVHKNKETGKINVNVNYAYAYDSAGNMIEMTKIHDSYNEIYEYDGEGHQIGYRFGSDKSCRIYKPFEVKDDKLLLAFLTLLEEFD